MTPPEQFQREEGEPRVQHVIKCWPEAFQSLMSAVKTFEIRTNDRDYRVGDLLEIHEWDPETREFTPAEPLLKEVTYITDWHQRPQVVVMAITEPKSITTK
jgi:hypothetical protein